MTIEAKLAALRIAHDLVEASEGVDIDLDTLETEGFGTHQEDVEMTGQSALAFLKAMIVALENRVNGNVPG
jgi:hypothetical protein